MDKLQNLLIALLFDKKKKKLLSKISQLKNVISDEITAIDRIQEFNYDALFTDWTFFSKNYKELSAIKKTTPFKIFVFASKKQLRISLASEHSPSVVRSIISNDFSVKKIQEIVDKYIKEYRENQISNDIIKKYETQSRNFNTLTQIGISLSTIKDIDLLLDMILSKSRDITNADAGSIYLVEETILKDEEEKKVTEKVLRFVHSQNYSFPFKSPTFTMPITKKSIVGYVALTGEILNIPDAHKIPPDAGYTYSIDIEKKINVHNRSTIAVAMRNQQNETIGVIQLFNKKKNFEAKIHENDMFDREVIPFSPDDEEIVSSLASQAGVSLENNILYKEIKNIFEGFIKASVVAIEARDPTTSGHSERVAILTKELGRSVNNTKEGIYANLFFKDEELKVIEYAGLLHDFGKIGVREKVLIKAKKLYPEDLSLLRLRYDYIKKSVHHDFALKKLKIIKEKGLDYFNSVEFQIDQELNQKLDEINSYINTILNANEPTILEENSGKIISELVGKVYTTSENENVAFLTSEETKALMVSRGSLTEEERLEIESHVTHTFKFLCNIPWTKEMASIPHIAYKHHEKLDGHGYPRGIDSSNIPVQARMMTIADIYDALTASDRPYKKAVSVEKALKILEMEVDGGKIDKELLKVFLENKVYKSIEK
ncbi:MAG TPA: HD domain-containing phosphohydrolase [Spirochaetota bacterium]|nr:HD domain-containing phosphohydrolase [Spirochaetota bacterium]